MEFDLDIALEFVEKVNPEPEIVPAAFSGSGTGDILLPILLCALFALVAAFAIFFYKTVKKNANIAPASQNGIAQKISTFVAHNKIAVIAATIVLAVTSIIATYSMQALAEGEQYIETPSKVTAYVDKENGTVEFDPSWLKNISDRDLMVEWSKVTQVEESVEIADLKDSHFEITGMDGTIFTGSPDAEFQYTPTDLSPLKIGQTSNMNFTLTKVTADQLIKLIGKKVFNIHFKFFDSIIKIPEAQHPTFNGNDQVGVEQGVGYTLTGTTTATNAGTFEATASLISGYVWDDGTYEDKTITWTLNPRDITLTSENSSWTYDATSHTNQTVNVTSGEWIGEDGVSFYNFASVIDYDAQPTQNSFAYLAEGKTILSNYNITTAFGNLQINKVETPIVVEAASDTKMYDATALTNNTFTYTSNVLQGADALTAEISGEITNVGTAENVVGEVKVARGNVDATGNYNFGTHKKGTLEITKRPITFTSASNTWTYDAKAHTETNVTVGGEGWAATDFATYSNFATITDFTEGGVANIFEYTPTETTDINNYEVSVTNGTLNISKITTPIVVTANSNSKTYDGDALTDTGFTFTDNILKEQDTLTAEVTGTQTNAGSSSNVVTSVKIMRGEAEATSNYTIGTSVDGTLTVTTRAITLTSGDESWTYDGTEHSCETITVTSGSWAKDEEAAYTDFASLIDVNETGIQNSFSIQGTTTTNLDNYNIKVINGKIKVYKPTAPLIIKALSATKTYDGQALTRDEYSFQAGIIAETDSLDISIEGSQTDAGTSENVVKSVKVLRDGKDVSANYNYGTNINGELKVEPRDVTITSKGATFTYDSEEHSCKEIEVVEGKGSFVEGEGVAPYDFATITDYSVNGVVNTFKYNPAGDTKLTNYNLSVEYKNLYVTKLTTPIVVTANDDSKTYDSTPLTNSGYTFTDNVVQKNDTLTATVEGTITDAGTTANVVKNVKITRGDVDASNNYTFGDNVNGTLTVNQIAITLKSQDQSWTYDGKIHNWEHVDITGEFVAGQSITFSNFAQVVLVNGDGEPNTYDYDAGVNTNLNNYNITALTGTLTINKSTTPIVVKAASSSRQYDGTALTNSNFELKSGTVAEGEVLHATVEGTMTDAGDAVPNTVTKVWITRGTEDVSSNYNFGTHENGTLQVTKRVVKLQSGSQHWTYDAQEHYNQQITFADQEFVNNEGVEFSNFKKIIDHQTTDVDNTFDYTKKEGTNLDNYDIQVTCGKINIDVITTEIVITAKDKSKIYDGQPLTQSEVSYTSGILQGQDKLVVETEGSIKDAGTIANTVKSYKVMRGEDPATGNYTFGTSVNGTLTVEKRPIIIKSKDKSWTYDKEEHTMDQVEILSELLWVEGEDAEYSDFPKIMELGQKENTFTMTPKGMPNFDNYDITKLTGTIQIVSPTTPIVVKAASSSHVYDGNEYRDAGYTFTEGILVEGHQLTATISGSITNVGTADNVVTSVTVTDIETGDDVTNYYYFDPYVKGTLTVTARPVTLTSDSATWEYDSNEHTCKTVTSSEGGFIGTDGVECSNFTKVIDVSATDTENKFEYTKKGTTDLNNYNISCVYGSLKITKVQTPIIITPNSETRKYNGQPLTNSGYTIKQGGKKDNDTLNVTISGSVTNVGTTAQNLVTACTLTRGGKDVSGNYNIGTHEVGTLTVIKREVTLTSASEEFAYTSTSHENHNVTVGGDGFVEGEGVTYGNFPTITDYTSGGVENSFTYTAPESTLLSNYEITPAFGTLTIKKVTDELIVTPDSASQTYNGAELKKGTFTTTDVLVGGDTVVATISGSQTNVGTSDNVVVDGSVHVMRGAIDVTANYTLGTNAKGSLTVSKRAVTITSANGEWTYDSQAHKNETATITDEATAFVSGEGVTFSNFKSITNYTDGGIDNTFDISEKPGTNFDNYEINQVCGKLNILKASALEITAASKEQTYNGQTMTAKTYTVTKGAVQSNDTLTVVINSELKNAGSVDNVIDSYTIVRDGVDVSYNYANITTVNGNLKINKKAVTLISDSGNWTYDATEHYEDKTIVKTGGWVAGEEPTYSGYPTLIDATDEPVKNTFTINPKPDTTLDNYEITEELGLLSVHKVILDLVVTAASVTDKKYDGTELTKNEYTYTDNVINKDKETLSATVTGSITDAGTTDNVVSDVKIMRGDVDATKNYSNISKVKGSLTVVPRQVTLTSSDATFDYTSTAQKKEEVTVSGDGFVDPKEGATYSNFASITDYTANGVKNTFTYTLNSDTKTQNYVISVVEGTLKINKVPTTLVITASTADKHYDGTALTASYTYTQGVLVGSDALTATISGSVTDVGNATSQIASYVIKRGSTDVTANYNVETANGLLTVKKRVVTLTSAENEWEYDSTSHSDTNITEGEEGFVNGEGATYSGFPSIIDVGEKDNTFSYALTDATKAGNYTITTATKKIKITQVKTPIKLKAASQTKTYDGSVLKDAGYTILSGVTKGSDTLVVEVVGQQTNAGSSDNIINSVIVMRGEADATANYSFGTHEKGTLKVNPLEVTCSWSSPGLGEYDGTDHYNKISANISNKVGTDDVKATIKVTLKGQTTEIVTNAGTYTATVTGLTGADAGNYKLPSTAPTQDYVLDKTSSAMTFVPGSTSSTYSTSEVTKSFTAATGASGAVTYAISGGDTGFSIPAASTASVKAAASQNAKTSYTVKIKATDAGDDNHNTKTVEGTLTWTINKATQTVSWAGILSNGYKLERNSSSTANYEFEFAEKGITYSTTNTDPNAAINLSGVSLPSGVSVDNTNKKIVIEPSAGTSFDLTIKATSIATTNYKEASANSTNIHIEISSLWWGFASGTVYLSPFNTTQATTPNYGALSSTSWLEVEWLANKTSIKKVVIQGGSTDPKIKPSSMAYWFYDCAQLTEISGFDNIDYSNVSNFSYTFANSSKISSLDLSNFTVDSTDITTSMFAGCSSLKTIKIGSNWARAFNDCSLPGEAWLDDDGKFYLTKDLHTAGDGMYNLAKYKLHIDKPATSVASLVLTTENGDTEFPDDIYFNDVFTLKLTTYTEEETYFDEELYDYVVEFNDYIKVEVVKQGSTKFTYNGRLQVILDGYQFVSWDVENTEPAETPDDPKVYNITEDDSLVVNLQAEKHATAVQYSDGSMKFYYDNFDHSKDTNFLASYNVANTKVNDETYGGSGFAPKVPDWISSAYHPFNNVTSITFDKTFEDFRTINHFIQKGKHIGTVFNSMSGWFMNFSNVESISGWNYVPSGVVDTRYMFYGFKNSPFMTTLDLSDFDMSNVIFANSMFANFGNNCSNVILPSGVSSNVDESMFIRYEAKSIDYSNMFADASTLQNVTFGENFGSSVFETSYSFMLKNCISIKKLDLTNCLNLGSSTDCDTEGMLTGCIGINSFIVGFGSPDPSCEKVMLALGLEDGTEWRSDSGEPYTPKNVPAKGVWYNCQSLIHLHFSNQAECPSAGGYGTSSNYSYDMDVFRYSVVKFDSLESKVQIGYMPDGSTFNKCLDLRLYVNDPYVFLGLEGTLNTPLENNADYVALYKQMGELPKTAKAIKVYDKNVSEYARFIFYYDTLTQKEYEDSLGDKLLEFYNVKNTIGIEKESKPEWQDKDHKGTLNNCEVIFDKSFKDFTSYKENDQTVQFTGMANWFSECSIKSLQGLENIPSCVTDIRKIFYYCDIMDSHDCLDLSKWDMSHVLFADRAFYTGSEITYEKLIIPDNFSSKRPEESQDYAQINQMFVNPWEIGTACKIHEIILGKNFGANAVDFSTMFYAMPELINVQFGENFASCKTEVISFQGMFFDVPSLISVDLTGLSEGGTYDITRMFMVENGSRTSLTTIVLPRKNVYISGATYAFAGLMKLTSLDFSHCTFTSKPSDYEGMLTVCYSLGEIVVGDSWMEDASLASLGCPTDTNFPWYRNDEPDPCDLYDKTRHNSIYKNHGVVKLRLHIPDEYKNIASFSYNGYEGLTEISFNLLTYNQATYNAGCWYIDRYNPKNVVVFNGFEELRINLKCSDDIFSGEWFSNYEIEEPVTYSKGDLEIYPILHPIVTPKAVYYYKDSTLRICNDSVSYDDPLIRVYDLTNEWSFPMYAEANVVIDPSFKDCSQYWDKKDNEYKEFNSCAGWFRERYIKSISGLENMSKYIKHADTMFLEATLCANDISLDFRGWDAKNIESACAMFSRAQLKYPEDVANINVYLPDNFGASASSTILNNMFQESCFSNISFGQNFAPQGEDYSNMFANMSSLHDLDLSTFTSTKDVNLSNLCSGCGYLSSVKLWANEVSPQTFSSAFEQCEHLNEVDMFNINVSDNDSYGQIFHGCKSLSKLKFGDLPADGSTITSLGYDWERARAGAWYVGQTKIEDFDTWTLQKGVVYENKDYVNLTISSPSGVPLSCSHLAKYEFMFKVLKRSCIESEPTATSLRITYNYDIVVNVNLLDAPSGLSWQNWEFDEGVSEDGRIISDSNISAYYDDGKTAKAVFYGLSSFRASGQPSEMRLVYDNLEYREGQGDVVQAFVISNTSAEKDVYPGWIVPGKGPMYYPKKVVVDQSFKGVKKCLNSDKELEDFYSIDYYFYGMFNAEFEGLENFPSNKIKSAQCTFMHTGPNPDIEYSQYNPYCSTLDLRGFNQDKLENIFAMFCESNYTDVLYKDNFGCNAKNIGRLFLNSRMLTHVDLSGIDTDKLDVEFYGSSCYVDAVAGLERINSFKVGDNWNMTMESVGFEDGYNAWIDYRGNPYSTKNIPEPNVLYKDAKWDPDLLALLNADGQTGDDQLLNVQNPDEDPQDKAISAEDNEGSTPSAGGAAALVGAPLALAALGFRRRLHGKHTKL